MKGLLGWFLQHTVCNPNVKIFQLAWYAFLGRLNHLNNTKHFLVQGLLFAHTVFHDPQLHSRALKQRVLSVVLFEEQNRI
jgi:hypothetical protein